MVSSSLVYGAYNGVLCVRSLLLYSIELSFHHLPVEEFDAPSLQQMHELHRIVQQAQEKHEACFRVVLKKSSFK